MTGERLGIYVDDVYVLGPDGGVSSDRAFLLFACEVGSHFEEAVLFGRTVRSDAPADYVLPRRVRLVALPHYGNLEHLGSVARATLGTLRGMWNGLAGVDVVWVFGPHPFGLVLIALSLARGKRVVLGVRQDTREYFRNRIAGGSWRPAKLAATALLDRMYRIIGRRRPATLVGGHVAAQYGGDRCSNLVMTVSLVPARALASCARRPLSQGRRRLLTVGRLEVEKNPLLIVEMLAELERRNPGGYQLTWIGRGALESQVRAHAARFGLADRIELRGYVAFGDGLFELYRAADVFVHVSLTEGVPQVLVEAMACGTPIVATAVGGVAELLEHGCAGLLVPPSDRDALVTAVERLAADDELRERLVTRGLQVADGLTFEAQSERVARFIAAGAR